jgi:hypothetical protein
MQLFHVWFMVQRAERNHRAIRAVKHVQFKTLFEVVRIVNDRSLATGCDELRGVVVEFNVHEIFMLQVLLVLSFFDLHLQVCKVIHAW